MRALVTGAAGQLGSDLLALIPGAVGLSRAQLSITDGGAVLYAVRGFDVVFNCAADNAVDAAETAPGNAFAVNADGAANVARACRSAGARLVHFSTNYVFDGTIPRPYLESDLPAPLSAYGRSKLDGERRVLELLPEALVIRSSGLFGVAGAAVKGGSFPERIVRRARDGATLRVVDDQRLNPTYTADLAARSVELAGRQLSGLVHLVADGCCSYWELAVEAVRLAGLSAEVERISSRALRAAAPRPRQGCLASERVAPLRHWREGLAAWWSVASATYALTAQ